MNTFIRKISIKGKLLVIIMITSISCLLLASIFVVLYNKQGLIQNKIQNISTISLLIANRSTAAILFKDSVNAAENLSALEINTSIDAAYIFDETGNLFATYKSKNIKDDKFMPIKKNKGYYIKDDKLYIYNPITIENNQQIGTIYITANLNEVYTQQKKYILFIFLIIIFLSIIAFIISSRLQLIISKPLSNLTKTAELITSKNDYSIRATRSSDDEIGILVDAFNKMLNMIEIQNTDKKTLIQELRDSQTMLNTILDSVPQSIFWKDYNSVYLGCNKAFALMAGLNNPNSIIGKTDFDLPWSSDESLTYRNDDNDVILKNTPKIHIIESIHDINGTKHWIDTSKIPLSNEQGIVYAILGVFEDITERKRAEEHLRESEEKMRLIFDYAFDGISIYEEDLLLGTRSLIDCNSRYAEMAGRSKEELIKIQQTIPLQKSIDEKMNLTGRFNAIELMQKKNLNKSMNFKGFFSWIRPDGKDNIIEYSAASITIENKIITIGLDRDITESKHAEEELRKSEYQLSAIYNNVSDCVFFLKIEPENNFRFISINETFIQTTGLKKDQIINKLYTDVIPKSAQKLVLSKYREAIETKETASWEEISEYPTGNKYGLVKVTPIYNEQGICTYLVGIIHDVTSIKEVENKIRQLNDELEQRVLHRTAQLESANKELEAFSYSVSHDLRAPLRAVIGFANILFEDYNSILDDEGKRLCVVIQNNAQRMGQLIDDLLTFSRLSRAEMNFSKIDMNTLIHSIYYEITTPEIRENITFNCNDVANAIADSISIRQVWINLISNAIKFSSHNKKPIITIVSKIENNFIIYCVEDNGVGFDMKYANKLFGVFQRLHSTKEFEGTGVGLAIIQRIILKHGGNVWAEAEVDKGAKFYFSLPITL